jgi:GNAT superfamily N-acetyltransferase
MTTKKTLNPLTIIPEHNLTNQQKVGIATLLANCFSFYPAENTYLHQIPNFRVIAAKNEVIYGHAALHFRCVLLDQNKYEMVGIGDLCVDPSFRGQGISTQLMDTIFDFVTNDTPFRWIMCFTSDPEFYARLGFQPLHGFFKWMMLRETGTLGVTGRKLHNDEIMLYSLDGNHLEVPVNADLLGPPF